jgi:hydroxymethylbilane synthase
VGSVDGARILQDQLSAPTEQAEKLGIELAERLLAAGAGEILAEVYGAD